MNHDDSDAARAPVPPPAGLPVATRRPRAGGDVAWRRQRVVLAAEYADGPLPSGSELKLYGEADPRAPRIIFDEFRAESRHRRYLERELVAAENRRADRGQIFALVVMLVGLGFSALLIQDGHDWAGVAVGGANLLGMAAIFLAISNDDPRRDAGSRSTSR